MRVLITDGDARQALATTRSLGQQGHFVVVVSDVQHSLAGVSRYCSVSVQCPSPAHESTAFVEAVVDCVKRHQVDVLLPMTEISTLLLAGARERLPHHCRLPFPSHDSIQRANNKAKVIELARRIGIPIPASLTISSPLAMAVDLDELQFPVVIKSAHSRVATASGWVSNSVKYAADAEALHLNLAALPAASYPVLLQERIQGQGVGVFMLFDRGRPVARFAHRRLREKPPSGGVSVLCESIAVDPIAATQAERLLQELAWHGPAMVEFKRDIRDGSLRLMEVNGRFWGSLQLAIDAGVDFPGLLVGVAMDTAATQPVPYRTGVRCRWLAGDLDSLLLVLLKDHRRLNLPPSHPGRLRSLLRFLRIFGRDANLEIERWFDMGPARLEWRRRLFGA